MRAMRRTPGIELLLAIAMAGCTPSRTPAPDAPRAPYRASVAKPAPAPAADVTVAPPWSDPSSDDAARWAERETARTRASLAAASDREAVVARVQRAHDALTDAPRAAESSVPGTSEFAYVIDDRDGRVRVYRVPRHPQVEPLAREERATRSVRGGGKKRPAKPPIPIVVRGRVVARAELPLPPHARVTDTVQVGDDLRLRIETPLDEPRWVRYDAGTHRVTEESPRAPTPPVVVTRTSCHTATERASAVLSHVEGVAGAAPALVLVRSRGADLEPALRVLGRAFREGAGRVLEVELPSGADVARTELLAACGGALRAGGAGAVVLVATGADAAVSKAAFDAVVARDLEGTPFVPSLLLVATTDETRARARRVALERGPDARLLEVASFDALDVLVDVATFLSVATEAGPRRTD